MGYLLRRAPNPCRPGVRSALAEMQRGLLLLLRMKSPAFNLLLPEKLNYWRKCKQQGFSDTWHHVLSNKKVAPTRGEALEGSPGLPWLTAQRSHTMGREKGLGVDRAIYPSWAELSVRKSRQWETTVVERGGLHRELQRVSLSRAPGWGKHHRLGGEPTVRAEGTIPEFSQDHNFDLRVNPTAGKEKLVIHGALCQVLRRVLPWKWTKLAPN